MPLRTFVLALIASSACAQAQPSVRRINPPTLYAPVGYTHAVSVSGGRTIYVSGEVPLDKDRKVVGAGDFSAQVRQVFENVKAVLAAADATMADVIKINVYLVDASQIAKFREVRDEYFKSDPPASTAVEVRALLRPEVMVEMEVIAVAK
jgi:reactive intermediate/imine deaminase